MSLKDIKNSFKRFTDSDNKIRIIVIIGIIGIVLIALSGVSTPSSSKHEQSSVQAQDTEQTELYRQQVKTELEDILKKIDGVGECSVMLSVEGTSEYIYAQNIDKTQDYSSNGSNEKYQSEIVMIDNGSKQALVKKIIRPKITGVIVVCQGGGNISVKERVIKAVSAALDLSYGKICVEGKTKIER